MTLAKHLLASAVLLALDDAVARDRRAGIDTENNQRPWELPGEWMGAGVRRQPQAPTRLASSMSMASASTSVVRDV